MTAGAHTERIDTTTVDLGDESILSGGEELATSRLVVILYAVDEVLGMLKSYADGDTLGADSDTALIERSEGIVSRMAGGEDKSVGTMSSTCHDDADSFAIFYDNVVDMCFKMHFTATRNDGMTYTLDDMW